MPDPGKLEAHHYPAPASGSVGAQRRPAVRAWLAEYGGHALIAAGALLFSTVLPNAAGPPDALAGAHATPPPARSGARSGVAPLLIPSSRRSAATPPAAAPAPGAPGSVASGLGGTTAVATVAALPTAPVTLPTLPEVVDPVAVSPAAPPLAPALPPTTRVVIPKIKVDTKVVDVGVLPSGEMETAAFAAGRLAFTPQAGEAGNVVLAGHNDIQGEVFRRLPELLPGDEVVLYRGDTVFRYRVETRTIVREEGATEAQRRENARWLDPTDESVTTLISCYPYRVDTHRIVVRARLVD